MQNTKKHAVAVVGAAGHTGKFVVNDLISRGCTPVAIVRNSSPLNADKFPQGAILRSAVLEDAASLDAALAGTSAVIHCAGPFVETADAVVQAALRLGVHYLDVSAEQRTVQGVYEQYDQAAQEAGVSLVPGMGFYGGFIDLLVTAAMEDWEHADNIEIMIGLDRWHPTKGTRITGQKNITPRVVIRGGRLAPIQVPSQQKEWNFGDSFGARDMLEVPFSEVIQIAQHLEVTELHTWLTRNAITDVRDPATPAPQAVDAAGRSGQQFVVEAVIQRSGRVRRLVARGQDIYAFSASLIGEAATRLLGGGRACSGAKPPAVLFAAADMLSSLKPYLASLG
jgi:Saccharopine dehydrogenase NADP binding domain